MLRHLWVLIIHISGQMTIFFTECTLFKKPAYGRLVQEVREIYLKFQRAGVML